MFGWRWVQSWGDRWRGSVRKVKERERFDILCVQRNVQFHLKILWFWCLGSAAGVLVWQKGTY